MLIQKNSIQQYQVRYKNKPETYKQKNIPVDIPLSTSFTKSFDKNIMVKDEQSTLSHKSEKPQSSSYKSLPLTPGLTQKKQPKLEQEYKREELPKSPFSSPSRLQPKTLLNQKIDLSTLKNKYRQSDSIFTFKTGINPKTPTKKSPLS